MDRVLDTKLIEEMTLEELITLGARISHDIGYYDGSPLAAASDMGFPSNKKLMQDRLEMVNRLIHLQLREVEELRRFKLEVGLEREASSDAIRCELDLMTE
ncbi:MAG: hypothetical protein HZA95_02805 [Candidatus Vogelbacteria bacterium]|nr:hypothetical protein [Candidatus Vogelbacteria bacterium]